MMTAGSNLRQRACPQPEVPAAGEARDRVTTKTILSVTSSIRTARRDRCLACGSEGEIAHAALSDRIFGVAGEWTLKRCGNRDCSLLWLDPMPIEEDLPKLYQGYYTHAARRGPATGFRGALQRAYCRSRFGSNQPRDLRSRAIAALLAPFPGVRAELSQQVFELPARTGGRLLDIGCGSGAGMIRMADLGWQVEGVDFDEEAVRLAASQDLAVRFGSVEQQAYPAASFDAIVTSHVLEHVWDPDGLLRECHRILKPGGRLVCITPNAASWCHALFKGDWRGLEPPRHLHIFTRASLSHVARRLDWASLDIRSTVAASHYMAWSSFKLRAKRSYSTDMRPSVAEEIAARGFQMMAAARHALFREDGEELVMHAVKPVRDR
jgi:2-polyprenyl-3-methyl-5-hydroxy-6-metoxy-1,4-benzoquinol methylase